jgi:hypothetical protein
MNEFRVNKHITLKLENNKTNIYVNEELFDQCKYLLLDIPIKTYEALEEIESVDEAVERLDKSMEGAGKKNIEFPSEVEFWGHCSSIQVWNESKYDTRLLHRSLAFPLLKKLADLGDQLAKIKLREEIVERFESGFFPVVEYLINENYFKYFKKEEILEILLESEEEKKVINELRVVLERDFYLVAEMGFYDEREPSHSRHKTPFSIMVQNKHVVGIDLTSCQLKEIPKSIFQLSSLKKLYLDHNEIELIPREFEKLTILEQLSLKGNKIESLPNFIAKLRLLKDLGLEINRLQVVSESILKLNSLESLHLGYNFIKLIPNNIGKLQSLENLDLEHNEIKEIPTSIGNLKSLENLNLEDNFIKKIPKTVKDLKSPLFIRLINNPLTSEAYEFIEELKKSRKYIIMKVGQPF